MPPEAKDVSKLMKDMVVWINNNKELPCPIVAGIAHYQFATIHLIMTAMDAQQVTNNFNSSSR